jgi:hypothetical protein
MINLSNGSFLDFLANDIWPFCWISERKGLAGFVHPHFFKVRTKENQAHAISDILNEDVVAAAADEVVI